MSTSAGKYTKLFAIGRSPLEAGMAQSSFSLGNLIDFFSRFIKLLGKIDKKQH
jgi:hypothetical protein